MTGLLRRCPQKAVVDASAEMVKDAPQPLASGVSAGTRDGLKEWVTPCCLQGAGNSQLLLHTLSCPLLLCDRWVPNATQPPG